VPIAQPSLSPSGSTKPGHDHGACTPVAQNIQIWAASVLVGIRPAAAERGSARVLLTLPRHST
jgi:hypothetical protein